MSDRDKAIVIQELGRQYAVAKLLRVAGMPRSTYYYWTKVIQNPDKYSEVKQEIQQIYDENKGRYGYRRITLELRNRGRTINHKTVQRLMKQLGLKSLVRIKKYRSYRGQVGQVAPNLLARNFNAERPNQKWVTDVTEFALLGSKVYFSPILDLYNSEVISYAITDRPHYGLVEDMLHKALQTSDSDLNGLIIHSDQGWHYQMKRYQNALKKRNIQQSMSRKGNCLDNAVVENFFGLLKSEFFHLNDFTTISQFKNELEEYVRYYNSKRIKAKLKGLSPIDFRLQSLKIS